MALAQLQEQLSAQVFPQVFVGVEPRLPTNVEPDASSIDTLGVRAAADRPHAVERGDADRRGEVAVTPAADHDTVDRAETRIVGNQRRDAEQHRCR